MQKRFLRVKLGDSIVNMMEIINVEYVPTSPIIRFWVDANQCVTWKFKDEDARKTAFDTLVTTIGAQKIARDQTISTDVTFVYFPEVGKIVNLTKCTNVENCTGNPAIRFWFRGNQNVMIRYRDSNDRKFDFSIISRIMCAWDINDGAPKSVVVIVRH